MFYIQRKVSLLIALSLAMAVADCNDSHGTLMITDAGTNYVIDFEGTVEGVNEGVFTGAGISNSPTSGQIDANGWAFSGSPQSDRNSAYGSPSTHVMFSRGVSNGGEITYGIYGFNVSNDSSVINRALGFQANLLTFSPGFVDLRIQNDTGDTITEFDFSYTVHSKKIGVNRSVDFSHSLDNTNYTLESSLQYVTDGPNDLSAPWESELKQASLSGLSILDGEHYFLRWTLNDAESNPSGHRDNIAIDDITIANINGSAVPEPGSLGLATLALLGLGGLGRRWR